MKSLIPFIFILFFSACNEDDLKLPVETKIPVVELTPKQECIVEEILNDSISGFLIFDSRSQDRGKLIGTKINEPFSAGISLIYKSDEYPTVPDSFITIGGGTTGGDINPLLGENIQLRSVPFPSNGQCFPLTSARGAPDSVRLTYSVVDFDVTVLRYVVDTSFDNYFYLDTFNNETGFLRGYFSARMIADTGYLPEIPQIVEFIDVEITAP